jgi:hypothetical protein
MADDTTLARLRAIWSSCSTGPTSATATTSSNAAVIRSRPRSASCASPPVRRRDSGRPLFLDDTTLPDLARVVDAAATA